MVLDADPEVVRVAAQPMWLRWTAESGRSVRHAPDYLGMVAQDQRRFAEAEASYRQALDVYQEYSDQRSASATATQLGIVYSMLGQHHQAGRILLSAAVSWHQETGQWATQDLRWRHRQRAAVGTEEFRALMTAEVPADLTDELTAAIETATDPEDADSIA